MKPIYLDYAAATPVRKEVLQEMRKYEWVFANPSSVHFEGVRAREVVEDARERVRKLLGASSEDKIIFTSGGTESINLALLGVARMHTDEDKNQIVTSLVEHKAVLETCKQLEKEGFVVNYSVVDRSGAVWDSAVGKKIHCCTLLLSLQYVNNETGIIQPIPKVTEMLEESYADVLVHTDACQAGLLDLNVNRLGVDLLTLNSSKVYGPHGVGLLYVREGVDISPLMFGGGQEYGLRSGTENVAGIVGFVYALELLQQERKQVLIRLQGVRRKFVADLCAKIEDVEIITDLDTSMPTILSVGFRGVEAETLVQSLSALGVYISAGSACTAQQIEVSHVLRAMRVEDDVARGVVRFSFGRETKARELKKVVGCVKKVVESLRKV